MKKFEEARLEIIELNEPDVIATSDCPDDCEDDMCGGHFCDDIWPCTLFDEV